MAKMKTKHVETMFHSSVPEGERLLLLRHDDLHRAAIALHKDEGLQVHSVTTKNLFSGEAVDVVFMLYGCPILNLEYRGYKTEIRKYSETKSTGKNPNPIGQGSTACRAVGGLRRGRKNRANLRGLINEAAGLFVSLVQGHVRLSRYVLKGDHSSNFDYKALATQEDVASLLEVFFGERHAIDVSARVRENMEGMRRARDRYINTAKTIDEQLTRLFSVPKWLVTHLPDFGYTVRRVDLSESWRRIMEEPANFSFNKDGAPVDMHFFRRLEDMPEEMQGGVLSGLTYAKMFTASRSTSLYYAEEPHDLVPAVTTGTAVVTEVGTTFVTYSSLRSAMIDAG